MKTKIERLAEIERNIQRIAKDLGLDAYPLECFIVPEKVLLETVSYEAPSHFSHWSFGRDFARYKALHSAGTMIFHEFVFSRNPCQAHIRENIPFIWQVAIMAHVYAHSDFYKNNVYFQQTSLQNIADILAKGRERVRNFVEKYGIEVVERVIEAGQAMQWQTKLWQNPENLEVHEDLLQFFIERLNTDTSNARKLISEHSTCPFSAPRIEDSIYGPYDHYLHMLSLQGLVPTKEELSQYKQPKRENWEQEILKLIKLKRDFILPQLKTKIINEGWAAYWQSRIMERLFQEGILSIKKHHWPDTLFEARLLQPMRFSVGQMQFNPYRVGCAIFQRVRERLGRQSLFEARKNHCDRSFIEEFLTAELIDELDLYPYQDGRRVLQDAEKIRQGWIRAHTDFGIPQIEIMKTQGRILYLKHLHDGRPLDERETEMTLQLLSFLWGDSVYLETIKNKRQFHLVGRDHSLSLYDPWDEYDPRMS